MFDLPTKHVLIRPIENFDPMGEGDCEMRVLPPVWEADVSIKPSPLDRMIRKLGTRDRLSEEDRQAILELPHVARVWHPLGYVVREGQGSPTHCTFVQSGFAVRQKLTADGGRQIVSIHSPGDFLDLQNLFLVTCDHDVQALTALETIGVEREALGKLALQRPNVAKAMWMDSLVDASIYREWIMNVGRRDARTRIAHVLCELALRSEIVRVGTRERFELPVTQEQPGDVTGLTSVHVNRTLKSLAADGVVHRDRRYISFFELEGDQRPRRLQSAQPAPRSGAAGIAPLTQPHARPMTALASV